MPSISRISFQAFHKHLPYQRPPLRHHQIAPKLRITAISQPGICSILLQERRLMPL